MREFRKTNTGKGWFSVPGIRENADRTKEEQMLGLERGLAEAKGKSVLDLGCAEGVITAEFIKAGAARAVGIELLDTHLAIARQVCAGMPVEFIFQHLKDYAVAHQPPEQFDIVLALGIIHKMEYPEPVLRWAAESCADLFLFRAPAMKLRNADGSYIIKSKHSRLEVNVPKVMVEMGFKNEGTVDGVRGEAVEYWRRARQR